MKDFFKALFSKDFEINEKKEKLYLGPSQSVEETNGAHDLLSSFKDIVLENERLQAIRENLEQGGEAGPEMERLMKNILPCLDGFQRILYLARNHPPSEELYNWLKSVESIYFRIKKSLENVGLVEIETIGKSVDLDYHEVVDYVTSNEHPNETIIHERQKGYLFQNKVLRDAQVVVAHNERR